MTQEKQQSLLQLAGMTDVFRELVESSEQAIGMADLAGNIVFANTALCRILGHDKLEDAIGTNVGEYYTEEDLPRLHDEVLPSVFAKGHRTVELPIRSSKGTVTSTIQSIFLIRNQQGEPLLLANVITDITEHRLIEEALRISEERYRSIFEAAPASIIILDRDGLIADINSHHVSEVSRNKTTRDDFIGKHLPTHPSIVGAGLSEHYNNVLTGEPFDEKEIYFSSTTGGDDDRYFNVKGVPLFRDGEVIGAITMHDEITERKRAEEELKKHRDHLEEKVTERTRDLLKSNEELQREIAERSRAESELSKMRSYLDSIIDSMPSILVGVDLDGKVTLWNREAERITGKLADAVLGAEMSEAIPRLAGMAEKVRAAIRSGEVQKEHHVTSEVEGEQRCFDITVYPLTVADVEGAVIRADDVTEHARMQELMIQSEKMLSVGGLAAGMAHEINNPLAGIMQNAQLLEQRISGDLVKNLEIAEECGISMEAIQEFMEKRQIFRVIEDVMSSSKRAVRIVDNILSFSRKGNSIASTHDIAELLDKTVELAENDYDLKKHYDFRQIEIERQYDLSIPMVPCDGSKVQQVFFNILRNGSEAMFQAGTKDPRFELCLKQDGHMVCVEIGDNGPGMEDDVRKRVFEPFFTTKDVGIGTGLGLSVSYFIITETHRGTMTVESSPGKGARFIICLPLRAG